MYSTTLSKVISVIYGPQCQKTCLQQFVNNNGADQPAHSRSLISTFVVRLMESNMSKHAASKFSTAVAEETRLSFALSETLKTGFVVTRPICVLMILPKTYEASYEGSLLQ